MHHRSTTTCSFCIFHHETDGFNTNKVPSEIKPIKETTLSTDLQYAQL